jgi:hypothetical protein
MDLPRTIFVVRLRALPNVNGIWALRAALKVLLRRYGLKCISVEVETASQIGGNHDGNHD